MSGLKALLAQENIAGAAAFQVPVSDVLINTLGTGMVIALAAYFLDSVLAKKSIENGADPLSRMINASNQLIMCVGVGGMMLLIEQNIVRAVVLFAALALVRFRVRVSEKSLSASFFFSVIAGMAVGMGEMRLAWIFTGVFVCLSGLLSFLFWWSVPAAKIIPVANSVEKI